MADQWILTAGHCVDSAISESFIIGDQTYTADAWYIPSTYSPADILDASDIALIHITDSFSTDIPRRDYNRGAIDPIGQDFELVGYGLGGTGTSGSFLPTGTKRSAWNIADEYFDPATFGNAIISSDFDVAPDFAAFDLVITSGDGFSWEEDGPLVLEGGVAGGDSGGPDMLAGAIIGVHSFVYGVLDGVADSSFTDISGSVNTVPWAAWLDSVIAGNGTLDPIADTSTGSPDSPIFDPVVVPELVRINTEAFLDYMALNHPDLTIVSAPNDRGYFLGSVAVPEPGTLSLLGIGVLGLLRRRCCLKRG